MGLLGDKLSYLPGTEEPLYERRPFSSRLQGEVRQVLGTPTSGRHNHQAAARLAGQHFLASPPDLHSNRRGGRGEGEEEAELDSEISSLFGEERNLHLMSPMEYAAVLGQDITPDSGVVMDSRIHSRVSPLNLLPSFILIQHFLQDRERDSLDVKSKRENLLASSRAAKNEAANESTESSDSSSFGSRGRNDSLLQRNGRYIRVPTNEDHLERVRDESKDTKKEALNNSR